MKLVKITMGLLMTLLTSCSAGDNSSELSATDPTVPKHWGCQYYSQYDDQSVVDNLMVDIIDGDGDGEYRLDVHLYQKRKGKVIYDGDLYKWERDGVKLIHLGNNVFMSPKGTIKLVVKDAVSSDGFSYYKGEFTSEKYGIKKLAKLTCSWNGQESAKID